MRGKTENKKNKDLITNETKNILKYVIGFFLETTRPPCPQSERSKKMT